MSQPLSVMWLGLRGFPGVQGGVETHAEYLCPLLVELGCSVHVLTRSPYQSIDVGDSWKRVHFHSLWAPHSRGLEAILHTFLGVLYAGLVHRPDVLHIQAIGPAIMTPLARLLGLKVVVTHHGPDYDRQKWGRFAKFVLQLGGRLGMRWANERIVISKIIQNIVWDKQEQDSVLIPNGVVLPVMVSTIGSLLPFSLTPGKYIVLVSRLVPEKRHIDLIEAFHRANLEDWKLAIVGSADYKDGYTRQVLEAAAKVSGVVCTGFQSGQGLSELYAHAGFFVLPSSHEGLPIAILEALSYGLPVVASDIPANLEVGLPAEHYFSLGDVNALAEKLCEFATIPLTLEAREIRRSWVSERFDWNDIARRTMVVYEAVVSGRLR